MNNNIKCPTCKTKAVQVVGTNQQLDEVFLVVEVLLACENDHSFKEVYHETPDGCFRTPTTNSKRMHI